MIQKMLTKFKSLKIYFYICLAILGVIFIIIKEQKQSQIVEENPTIVNKSIEEDQLTITKPIETFFVDIKGEVKKPGIYEVNENTMVNDLINLAGGLTKNGTTKNINLSKKLSASTVVIISSKKESGLIAINNSCTCKEIDITPCEKSNIIENSNNNDDAVSDNIIININSATKDELMTLPSIGESKAKNIITYREENGMFSNIEDILNVSGIGDAIFAQIKKNITL